MMKYEQVKDSGDLTEVRKLKTKLDEVRDSLTEQLFVFRVPDAHNPYHEALMDAGLESYEVREKKEIMIDIRQEIQRQLILYREATDSDDMPVLQAWMDDIMQNEALIYAAVAKDRTKIEARIKAGMIPIVMPSRHVQQRTWIQAITHLKPLCFMNNAKQKINAGAVSHKDRFEMLTRPEFFASSPDRPYIVWTQPTRQPNDHICNLSFTSQRAYKYHLVSQFPDLYDEHELAPTEYLALQAAFTSAVRVHYQLRRDHLSEPTILYPLDVYAETAFIPFLNVDDDNNDDGVRMSFNAAHHHLNFLGTQWMYKSGRCGFRPASRT